MTEQPEPTARERLINAMTSRTCFCGADSCQNAEQYVDAYAHELAELQRLRMDELDLIGQKARIVGRIVDLIDPEAQR
jgi:hypothetical protein